MKRAVSALMFLVCSASTFASGSDCTTIKQDKQRLRCYDTAATTSGNPATATPTPEQNKQQEQEFKASAVKFLQSAQANLAISIMQWQTFMANPNASSVPEISSKNTALRSEVATSFSQLMAMPGQSGALPDKLKDFYAAWGLSFQTVRPTSADSGRYFQARTNNEISRMDAMAVRLKMDLQ